MIKLREHEAKQHPNKGQKNTTTVEIVSPSSSPPRKKIDLTYSSDNFEESVVEMTDLTVKEREDINNLLETKIKQLEIIVAELEGQKQKISNF